MEYADRLAEARAAIRDVAARLAGADEAMATITGLVEKEIVEALPNKSVKDLGPNEAAQKRELGLRLSEDPRVVHARHAIASLREEHAAAVDALDDIKDERRDFENLLRLREVITSEQYVQIILRREGPLTSESGYQARLFNQSAVMTVEQVRQTFEEATAGEAAQPVAEMIAEATADALAFQAEKRAAIEPEVGEQWPDFTSQAAAFLGKIVDAWPQIVAAVAETDAAAGALLGSASPPEQIVDGQIVVVFRDKQAADTFSRPSHSQLLVECIDKATGLFTQVRCEPRSEPAGELDGLPF